MRVCGGQNNTTFGSAAACMPGWTRARTAGLMGAARMSTPASGWLMLSVLFLHTGRESALQGWLSGRLSVSLMALCSGFFA